MKKEFSWFTHQSGIRCVHRQTKSDVAYVAITVNSGTRDELPTEHGVAHLTEHMLFKGTAKRSAFHIGNRLESRGGDLNAYTTKEETAIHATCLKTDFRRALELLIDMAFNSSMNEKDINSEREIIIDEINSYKDSPSELIFDHFEEELFRGSALGRNILGDKRQLKKIGQKQLNAYVNRNFTTNRMIISSSCNLSHERFEAICNDLLSNITPCSSTMEREKPEKQSIFDLAINRHTHQTHTLIGGYAYDIYSPKRIPLALLTNILGGPFSLSLLNQSLRERKALTYNVETSYTPFTDSGLFTIYYGCEESKNAQAKDLVLKELKELCDNLMTSGKFHRFKRQFLGQLVISNDNQESLMLSIAKSLITFNDFDTTEELYRKIESLTREEILSVANEVMNTDNLYTLTYN